MTESNSRVSEYPIDKLFLDRWSPRAFQDVAIPEADLFTMFEAARWAPSSYNSQPWRFLYALRGTPSWDKFLGLLIPFNQSWAQNASALIILVSAETMRPPGKDEDVPTHSHSADAGAAWGSFALQASLMGWQAHGMTGFDIPRAAVELGVPAGYRVELAAAVGKPGDKSILPEALAAREAPSARRPLSEIVMEGGFKA